MALKLYNKGLDVADNPSASAERAVLYANRASAQLMLVCCSNCA